MAIIYKITNQINNKIYIGETTRNLNVRWNEHKYESYTQGHGYNYHLHRAIRKYGIENFIIEMIDNCPDEDRFKLESYYIKLYDSSNKEKGYNNIVEGSGHITISTDSILEAWNEGLSVSEISKLLSLGRQPVAERLKLNGINQEDIIKRGKLRTTQKNSRSISQYNLKGEYINSWPSVSECERQTGFNQSALSSVCRQEQLTAYGYLWKYDNDYRDINEWVINNNNKKQSGKPKKKTAQLDESHNIIHIYDSAAEAAKALNKKDKSNICRACRNNCKAYGFYWEYVKEN